MIEAEVEAEIGDKEDHGTGHQVIVEAGVGAKTVEGVNKLVVVEGVFGTIHMSSIMCMKMLRAWQQAVKMPTSHVKSQVANE